MVYRLYYLDEHAMRVKRYNPFEYRSMEEIEEWLDNPPLKYDFGTRIQLIVFMGKAPSMKMYKIIEPRNEEIKRVHVNHGRQSG